MGEPQVGLACDLLVEGFPMRPASFWDMAFDRLRRLGGNAAAGVPYGYLFLDKEMPVGILLTPAGPPRPSSAEQTTVNLSSWYVRPAHRWRAPAMLSSVLKQHEAVFTDLTANKEVLAMLPKLGFAETSPGVAFHATALTALAPGKSARIVETEPAGEAPAPSVGAMLAAHRSIGCMVLDLQSEERSTPIMLRRRRVRGMPAAELVYCGSNTLLAHHLPSLARYLLKCGVLWLIADSNALPGRSGHVVRHRQRFAKIAGSVGRASDITDYAYSELCVLDL